MADLYANNIHGFNLQLTDIDPSNEIDLRQEVSDFLDDRGYYIFLRRRTKQHCPYWNSVKGECTDVCSYCDGTGWAYVDYKHKTRRKPGINIEIGPQREIRTNIGYMSPHRNVFYFKYNVNPLLTDLVLEVKIKEETREPVLAYQIERIFDVRYIHAFRDQRGRIEYWVALADERVLGP